MFFSKPTDNIVITKCKVKCKESVFFYIILMYLNVEQCHESCLRYYCAHKVLEVKNVFVTMWL